ncbi:MAG: hypothetical protein QNJ98_09600 [Planctomycetota bacterium]|nr:hypothetical protein [Planctomycetota bacterium]
MNADERFMDMLLERTLGRVQAPPLENLPRVLAAHPVPPLAPVPRPRTRHWAWSAAAILLLGLGIWLGVSSVDAPERTPRGVKAPASSAVAERDGLLHVESGYALVDDKAPPVAFEGGVLTPVGGQVIVVVGDVPAGPRLSEMLAWLTGTAGVNADVAGLLREKDAWFAGRAGAMALLGGGALLSGTSDMTWAGRTWHRDRVDAPPRVALVASRDAVGRLGRLASAMKVADVDAGGMFLAALSRIDTLEHVDLTGCRGVDDDALRPLGRLLKLKTLSLAHTRVGNRGMAWLTGCEQLERLDLRGLDGITDEGIVLLADTHEHRLAHLDLRGGPRVTGAVLEALGRCTALRSLALSVDAPVDAASWRALESLESLRSLHLDAEPDAVPGAVLDQLRASLPNCEIRVARTGMER